MCPVSQRWMTGSTALGVASRPPMTSRRLFTTMLIGAAAVGVASLLDESLATWATAHRPPYGSDWYAMTRSIGYLPEWIVVGAALAMIDARGGWRGVWSRGGLLVSAATLAGGAAELLKMFVRRERPLAPFDSYSFRPWEVDTWSSAGLGWPSSHVAVAFGAVWVLWRLEPRARVIWLLLGCLCAWSRLAFTDHYLSDVVGAGFVAYIVAHVLASLPNSPPSSSTR